MVAAILRFFDSTYEAARIILSLNIIVFIVRSLQIFSVNRQLGPKLVMIRRMVRFCGINRLCCVTENALFVFVSYLRYITGVKFEQHHSNISRDILAFVMYLCTETI